MNFSSSWCLVITMGWLSILDYHIIVGYLQQQNKMDRLNLESNPLHSHSGGCCVHTGLCHIMEYIEDEMHKQRNAS